MKKNVVTLQDIAKQLNISANTVSRAINGKSGVGKEISEKVIETARSLGYLPNATARALRGGQLEIIGVIIDDNSNPYLAETLKYMEREASLKGYHILLFNSGQDPKTEIKALDFLVQIRANGAILHPTQLTDDLKRAIKRCLFPVVLLGMKCDDLSLHSVRNDNVAGAKDMMKHLLARGYRKICFLNLPAHLTASIERWQGVVEALDDFCLDQSVVQQLFIDVSKGVYGQTMRLISSEKTRPDCIFCGSDLYASQAMSAILDSGLSIPGDVALCGYDDMAYSSLLRVPLTTISQPKAFIAQQCVDLVCKGIDGNIGDAPIERILKSELIIRDST